LPIPFASSCRSIMSRLPSMVIFTPGGNASPPKCPGSVGAKTAWRSVSAGRTGDQACQVSVKPCNSTIGSP
jgi:hypothetical protein